MKNPPFLSLFVWGGEAFADPTPSPSADTIFLNGNLYTVNDGQPQAEAIAIKGDRILFAGSSEDAEK